MQKPLVVGIAGLPHSGKDTVAQFILAKFGGYRYAFADPIVRMLNAGFQTDFRSEEWVANKERPIPMAGNKSPRELRQLLGTEWGRNMVDKDLWITLAKAERIRNGPGMVIPDVRFPNEATFIRERGVLIHVEGPHGFVTHAHSSDTPLARLTDDLVIVNDGTLSDLQQKVEALFDVA